MLPGIPESAMCVQRFDDSRNSAIHTTYRNSLRSSSLREPRDPLSKVVFKLTSFYKQKKGFHILNKMFFIISRPISLNPRKKTKTTKDNKFLNSQGF